ncbi:MAG: protein kinase [Planctomycetota bacterium]
MTQASYHQPIRGYRILEKLGSGAMGNVYRARQTSLDRIVALKVMRGEPVVGRAALERLKKEARILARLDHPNIVRVFDMGEDGGYVYLAMELIEGKSLKELLAEHGPLAEGAVLTIAEKMASALEHASGQHVIHRDIKPGNILVGHGGVVKLSDFGLALTAVEHSITRTGHTVGTPQYIAPEQAGSSRRVDVRSDLYSLGATLYHALTGQMPFRGESVAEVITAVLFDTPKPPEEYVRGIHAGTSRILARLMAKRRSLRYQTPRELLDDLQHLKELRGLECADAADLGIDWAQAGRRDRTWYRRHEILVPAILLLVGLGVTTGLLIGPSGERERSPSVSARSSGPTVEGLRTVLLERGLPALEVLRQIDACILETGGGADWSRLRADVVEQLLSSSRSRIETVGREARAQLAEGRVLAARTHLERNLTVQSVIGSDAAPADLRRSVLVLASEERERLDALESEVLAGARDRASERIQLLEEQVREWLARGAFLTAARALDTFDYGPLDIEVRDREGAGGIATRSLRLESIDLLPVEPAAALRQELASRKSELRARRVNALAVRLSRLEAALAERASDEAKRLRENGIGQETVAELARGIASQVLQALGQERAELPGDEPPASEFRGLSFDDMVAAVEARLQSAAAEHARERQQAAELAVSGPLTQALRDRRYEEARRLVGAAEGLSEELRGSWGHRIEGLARLERAALEELTRRTGEPVHLETRGGLRIHERLIRVEGASGEIWLEDLGEPVRYQQLGARTVLELVAERPDVDSLQRAWLLYYEGLLEEAEGRLRAQPVTPAAQALLQAIDAERSATEEAIAAAGERLEVLLHEAEQQALAGDERAAVQRYEEFLADPWLRRVEGMRARIAAVRERRDALASGLQRSQLQDALRARFSGLQRIDQDGRIEVAYFFRSPGELADFKVDTSVFRASDQGLASRRPPGLENRDLFRKVSGPRLAVLFDATRPFRVQLDYHALITAEDPQFLGLRVQGLCFGIKSFPNQGLAAQINAWEGELDDFEPYFFDPVLGESRPLQRGFGTHPFKSLERGSRYTLTLEQGPEGAVTLYIEGLERVPAYTLRNVKWPRVPGIEFRTAEPALFEALRFDGYIDEKWLRSP